MTGEDFYLEKDLELMLGCFASALVIWTKYTAEYGLVSNDYKNMKLDEFAPLISDPPNATQPLCLVVWSPETEIYVTEIAYLPSLAKLP